MDCIYHTTELVFRYFVLGINQPLPEDVIRFKKNQRSLLDERRNVFKIRKIQWPSFSSQDPHKPHKQKNAVYEESATERRS